MKIVNTLIDDVKLIEPRVSSDKRGFFMETFKQSWFRNEIADVEFVQDNHSLSLQGVLRGLHYQTANTQGKLIRVIRGEIYDVAVDLRKNSATFGQYVGEYLSESNKRQLWIPPGFAHGLFVISDFAESVYKCTDYYSPKDEVCLLWNDQTLAIDWPLKPGAHPILSDKDQHGLEFSQAPVFN